MPAPAATWVAGIARGVGGAAATASAAIPPAAGIEEIANFTYGTDKLTLNLSDLPGSLQAFDTTIGSVHAIALAGMPAADTAANLLASHLTMTGGSATIT